MNRFKSKFGISASEFIIRMAIIMAVLIMCSSCKSESAFVNKSHEKNTSSKEESKQGIFTVEKYIFKDSIYYKEVVINDTVYKVEYRYRYIDKVVHDTIVVYYNRVDSIDVNNEAEKETVIETKESWWQRQKGELIWTIILAIIAIIVTVIYKKIKG